ncbi:hypothetical protein YOLOSWAG_312 [Erwinia phage vB_EamM_Yoloswag]|uniref:Uncharacterized protein n=1 Tax=Erwinia phage vB_EamM_Yoloswag TaxID=1958956 RepID=A0A1S6L3L7_9CAUD|nr:hypothetical protein HOR66_gp312 [Erwinia phage vB_EamM_Yoloswag]AQT28781.1 hypothetical protein YOLOSWAG_312 [Erwinia phage vB_EamM_Yoloswag]
MSLTIRSAAEAASMIVENVTLYSNEKEFETILPRFKMPETAIRRISGHARIIPESYIEQLSVEIQQLDWMLLRCSAKEFIFMHCDVPSNWTTLSAKRVAPNHRDDSVDD